MSTPDNSMRTPLARARGLGSAKDGVHHWWMQRLTAVVLALLTPWFLWQLVFLAHPQCIYSDPPGISSCLGTPGGAVRQMFRDPLHALPLLAFMLALFWHAKLGVQVVIEDYVHTRWLEVTLQIINTLACAFGALVSVFAIVRMMIAH
jgi:succinate dehydrogenase / fumarate reductase membrane anchor subunit